MSVERFLLLLWAVFRTWAYIGNKKNAPLIIHRWVGRPFYSALQGHVNVWFSGQRKTCLKQLLPWFDIKHMIQCIGFTVRCIYTAALIIQHPLPLKCDQSASTWCQQRPPLVYQGYRCIPHLMPYCYYCSFQLCDRKCTVAEGCN